MTTNGFPALRLCRQFADHGLTRINISLDTLRSERFTRLARRGSLEQTLEGIEAALAAGITPVKLNCVAMRGWNDDEVVEFARLSMREHIDVRFIELMPINWSKGDDSAAPLPVLAGNAVSNGSGNITLYANTELGTFKQSFHGVTIASPHGQLDAGQMRRAFISTEEVRSRIEAEFEPT